MIRRPPRATRTDTLFPYTTLFRSFLADSEAAPFGGGAWTLANPISEDLKVMRPSLLPGLLAAAERNLKRGATSVRLFEIGRRYLPDRSAERRVGNEGCSTCQYPRRPVPRKKHNTQHLTKTAPRITN